MKIRFQKIRKEHVYKSMEVAQLLEMDIRSLGRWVRYGGLKPLNRGSKPHLFLGQDLYDFLKAKKSKKKFKCKPDELFCLSCRKARRSKPEAIQLIKTFIKIGKNNKYQLRIIGICEVCGNKMSRLDSYTPDSVNTY